MRWILALQEYDFDVKYRSGNLNTFAAALSRLPVEEQINSLQTVETILDFDILPKIAEQQLIHPFF